MDSIQDCKHACEPFATQVLMPLLFYSQPVAADATSFPQWDLLINDTAPIWAYVSSAIVLDVPEPKAARFVYSVVKAITVGLAWSSLSIP